MKNTVKIPWMDELKKGDQIIYINSGGKKTIEVVTGVSKKSVFFNNIQFSKFTGKRANIKKSYFHYTDDKIQQITEMFAREIELERLKMIEELMTYDFSALRHKELRKIQDFLKVIDKTVYKS